MSNYLKRYRLTIGNNEEVIEKITPQQSESIIPNLIPTTGPVKTPRIGWFLQTIVDAEYGGTPEATTGTNSTNVLTIPAGVNAREFTQVQFEAEISYKTGQSNSSDQDATIKLYNLSKESQAFIKKNYFVFLEAGYQSDKDIPLIFTGTILKVSTEKSGPDVITKILCQDNGVPAGNIRMCIWWDRGVTYLQIIRDMLDKLASAGIPTGHFITTGVLAADPIIKKCESGYSTEGKLIQDLITLCSSINYKAYFSLGKMYVEPAFGGERVFLVELSPDQIKGTVRPEDDASNETLNSKTPEGLKITAFLDGRISTDKFLKVTDGTHKGQYKINEVKHLLSYEGDTWDTEISCSKVA